MAADLCSSSPPPPQPTADFRFCTPSPPASTASAEELFATWKPRPLPASAPNKDCLKEIMTRTDDAHLVRPSFWRSRSLKPGRLACSLNLLPRSRSAGSAPAPPAQKQPRRPSTSATNNPKSLRRSASSSPKPTSFPSQTSPSYHYGGSDRGGVRISPVLNIHPQCFPKGGGIGFFGFGYLFCRGGAAEKGAKKKEASASVLC